MAKKVNQQEAIMRLGGNKTLYVKISRKFLDEYSHVHEILLNRLSENKLREVSIIAHTLKGISGSLGAAGLQRICEEIEKELNQNRDEPSVSRLVTQFHNELLPVLDELKEITAREGSE